MVPGCSTSSSTLARLVLNCSSSRGGESTRGRMTDLNGVRVIITGASGSIQDYMFSPLKQQVIDNYTYVEVAAGSNIGFRLQNCESKHKWVEIFLDGQQAATKFLYPWESSTVTTWSWRGSSQLPLKVDIADIKDPGADDGSSAGPASTGGSGQEPGSQASKSGTIKISVQDILKLDYARPLEVGMTSYQSAGTAPAALPKGSGLKTGVAALVPTTQIIAPRTASEWQIQALPKGEFLWNYRDVLGMDLVRAAAGLPTSSSASASSAAGRSSACTGDRGDPPGDSSLDVKPAWLRQDSGGPAGDSSLPGLRKRKATSGTAAKTDRQHTWLDLTQDDDEEETEEYACGGPSMGSSTLQSTSSSLGKSGGKRPRMLTTVVVRVAENDGNLVLKGCRIPDLPVDDEVEVVGLDPFCAELCRHAQSWLVLDSLPVKLWNSEGRELWTKADIMGQKGRAQAGGGGQSAQGTQASSGGREEETPIVIVGLRADEQFVKPTNEDL